MLTEEYGTDFAAIKAARVVPWEQAVGYGRWDVQFWARRFLGVDLHPGQLRFAESVLRRKDTSGWRPAYFDIAVSAGNRAGKTMALAVVVLHSCFYKLGTQPIRERGSDAENEKEALRWMERPYIWYHFAIKQEVADLLWNEFNKFFSGTHEAQPDGCPMTEDFAAATNGRRVAEWEKKENGDYRWVIFDPELGGAEIKFRTTEGSKGTGSLGRDMNGISFDEAGLEDNLMWIYENVIRNRRLGTGGQVIFISTPEEGFTEFADYWFMGDPESPDRKPRHMSLRMSSRENVGFGLTREVFDDLVADMDEDRIKQNIDGYFIQGRLAYFDALKVDACFVVDLPELQAAEHGKTYLQGVDPGLSDKCWSLVFSKVNGKLTGVKAEWSRARDTESIVAMAVQNHDAYEINTRGRRTDCATAIDTTALGGHMFRDLTLQSLPTVTSVEFGGNLAAKRKLLGDLKTMIEQGDLKMPRTGDWLMVRRQMLGYKLGDRKIEQDAVMALCCIMKLVRRTPEGGEDGGIEFDATMGDYVEAKPRPNFRRRRS